jgi:hypothetical protein
VTEGRAEANCLRRHRSSSARILPCTSDVGSVYDGSESFSCRDEGRVTQKRISCGGMDTTRCERTMTWSARRGSAERGRQGLRSHPYGKLALALCRSLIAPASCSSSVGRRARHDGERGRGAPWRTVCSTLRGTRSPTNERSADGVALEGGRRFEAPGKTRLAAVPKTGRDAVW